MNVIEYFTSTFLQPFNLISILILVSTLFAVVNKFLMKKFICGIASLQFSTIIVMSVTIDLYLQGYLMFSRLMHLLLFEGGLSIIVLLFYRKITRIKHLDIHLVRFYKKYIWLWLTPIIFLTFANFYFVGDGGSRIEFQTQFWFSFLRPFLNICYPILVLGIYVNLYLKSYKTAFFLLFTALIFSISSGSKGMFIISVVSWFFVYRDIFKLNPLPLNFKTVSLVLIIISGAFINLIYVNVNLAGILERIISYADATILIYQADIPILACSDQSSLSLTHRGLARLLGDPSASNAETIFGFAVAEIFYGGHNFTGPNARIGAYALCAFPGYKIIYLIGVFFCYLFLLSTFVKYRLKEISKYKLIGFFVPFIIYSLMASLIDYNRVMSDITLIFIGYIVLVAYQFIPKKKIRNG